MILNKQNIHPSILFLLLLCAPVMRAAAYTEAQSPSQHHHTPPENLYPPPLPDRDVCVWMDVLVQFRFDVFLNRTRIGWMFLCFLLVWMNLILFNLVIYWFLFIFLLLLNFVQLHEHKQSPIFHVICTPEFIQLWAALQTWTKSRTAHKGSTPTSHCVCLFVLQTVKELGCQEQQKTSISSENA